MSSTRCLALVALLTALSFEACSRSAAPLGKVGQAQPSEDAGRHDVDVDTGVAQREFYAACEENDADTVLVVHVTIPGLSQDVFRVPLRLRRTSVLEVPLLSLWAQGVCGDGVARDGSPVGHVLTIGVDDSTDSTVTVGLDLSWTAGDRTRKSLDQSLVITVGKSDARELVGGAKVRWEFQDPVKTVEDESPMA
jgi:hypothetical protein